MITKKKNPKHTNTNFINEDNNEIIVNEYYRIELKSCSLSSKMNAFLSNTRKVCAKLSLINIKSSLDDNSSQLKATVISVLSIMVMADYFFVVALLL